MKNWNCENDKCTSPNGEIRVLPTGGDSNALLCRSCFNHEMRYREERNRNILAIAENKFTTPEKLFKICKWEDLRVYNPGE